MRRLLWAIMALLFCHPAYAQQLTPPYGPPTGIACAYNSSLPSLATGNAGWIQCDSSGRLLANSTQSPATTTGAYSAATVGTSDSTLLAAGTAKVFLDLVNNSPTATICINFGAAATISGAICAAGEITLPPLWHRSWENSFVPGDAIHAIASAASTPATVGAD